METKKQFFFMRAAMSLLVMLCSLGAWADDSGSCGTNVTYSYVESTHTLTISGSGAMEDYQYYIQLPWCSYANAITTVVIEDGVTSIGNYAFYCCTGVTSIEIPASVTSIGDYAFFECTGLTTVTFDGTPTLVSIGGSAFWGSGLTTVTIPASVTSIGNNAFQNCGSLATMTVAGENKVYDSRNGCNAIIEKNTNTLIAGCINSTIPASVTSIGDEAFNCCSGLTSVTIPAGVTSIDDNAFFGCSGLTSVTIPASVTSIGEGVFEYCKNLATITVEDGNTVYNSRNGCNAIIETSSNKLIAGCKNTTIPASVTSIGNYAFSGCSGLTSITIPAGVTSIGEGAFVECNGLTSISIPSSVTSIGNDAFDSCSNLTTVTIPSSVTSIGEGAFADCSNLISVIVNATTPPTLGDYAFEDNYDDDNNANDRKIYVPTASVGSYKTAWSTYKSDIMAFITEESGSCGTDVTWKLTGIPDNYVLTISGTGAMEDYSKSSDRPWTGYANGIKTVVIGSGVTSIGDYAFSGCSGLTSIEIPSSVTSIGTRAFQDCSGLTSIEIPSNVTSIGTRAFYGCSGLTSIEIPANVTSISQSAFYGCSGLTSVTIPAGVTSIGDYVFNECSNLATITVETSNTVYNSRNGCNAIIETSSNKLIAGCKNTTIPAGVTSIGKDAFGYCSGLTSIEIPASVTSIDDNAFFGCSGLTSVEIPASVTSIGEYAFDGCSGLATVTVYAPSCTLGDEAFSACSNLKNIYVFSDLVDDYKAAWSAYEKKITAMTPVASGTCGKDTPEDVTWRLEGEAGHYRLFISGTGEMADYGYSSQPWNTNKEYIKTVLIENGVTSIGECAFQNCTNLSSVTIPASVTSIGNGVFIDCEKLTTVSIPASVTTIGESAFGYCSNLTSIEIPASVTTIGEEAFNNTALTSIEIPASVTSIGNGVFNDCEKLTSITVAEGNANYSNDTNGALFNKDKTTLIMYPKGNNADSYEIPASVTSIGEKAFAGCEDLETVTLPASVTSIGDEAFYGCSNLTTVTIPSSVTTIGNSAFEECGSLTTINIPANVTSIGGQAFYDCNNLASVTLNSNPTIGEYAFFYNTTVTMNLAAAEVGGAHWTTFYNNYGNFQADENTEVYKGTVSDSKLLLTPISDKIVNAGNAVILKSTDNPVMTLKADNSTGDYSDNALKGLSERTEIATSAYSANTIYVMGNTTKNGFGFHKYTGEYMPANKAFLALGSGSSAPLRMVIDDDDEATGVASMADGIDDMSDVWYTLDGRKLNGKPTTKGLYIVNGKKVMIK
ncbi:MAG: leucine-rich repeat domain-containing protein [Bacteroidaceae bacterium]|nr:leucine-rich repeat domain-containing protein [Bacteroidaceae bacterium]